MRAKNKLDYIERKEIADIMFQYKMEVSNYKLSHYVDEIYAAIEYAITKRLNTGEVYNPYEAYNPYRKDKPK